MVHFIEYFTLKYLQIASEIIIQQESIPVGCVPPAFLVLVGGPSTPHPLQADPPLDADSPLDARHVTCDACWEATPPCEQIDRCKIITFPQLRFREVIIIQANENCFKSVTKIFVSGVRPVHNASETVRVHYGLSLIEILNFNTESGLLRARVWERYVRLHPFFCSYRDSGHIKYFSSQPLSNNTKLLDIYSYGKILSWSGTHRLYNGLDVVRVSPSQIWKPDLKLYNRYLLLEGFIIFHYFF